MKNLNKDTKIIFQVSISILDNVAQYGNFILSNFLVHLPRSCAWAANEYFVSPGGSDAPSIGGKSYGRREGASQKLLKWQKVLGNYVYIQYFDCKLFKYKTKSKKINTQMSK